MKRPRTTNAAAPPGEAARADLEPPVEPPPAPPSAFRETAGIVAALLAVLDAVEFAPKAGPAVRAYNSVMRRQGEAAAALGGHEAMEVVLRQIAEADPTRASARMVIVRAAWAGVLPGPTARVSP